MVSITAQQKSLFNNPPFDRNPGSGDHEIEPNSHVPCPTSSICYLTDMEIAVRPDEHFSSCMLDRGTQESLYNVS